MSVKYLINYVEICTVLEVEPTFKGLERYKSYITNQAHTSENNRI